MSHSGTGEGGLCGPGWIHAYEHPLIAVLMNPIHGDFKNPRLWEAEGEIGLRDGQLKCGCATLMTIREIPLPEITTEMRVRFAIMCVKEASTADAAEVRKAWDAWADRWLSGEDRTQAAADTAWTAARAAAKAAVWAAETRAAKAAAAWMAAWAAAARAATEAAWAAAAAAEATAAWMAAWAAEAAWTMVEGAERKGARPREIKDQEAAARVAMETREGADIFAIAEKACSGVHTFEES